jgi:hypothetical protein
VLGAGLNAKDLADVVDVLIGVAHAHRHLAGLHGGARFGEGEGLDAELRQGAAARLPAVDVESEGRLSSPSSVLFRALMATTTSRTGGRPTAARFLPAQHLIHHAGASALALPPAIRLRRDLLCSPHWYSTPRRRTRLAGARCSWKAPHMTLPPETLAEDVIDRPLRVQFEVFLDEHRTALSTCLDGLTEQQARRSLVASRTTLLGLVKHATFAERVWFDEAITRRSRAEIGIPATPDESFILRDDDTIETVQRVYREACESSRLTASALGLDDIVRGNRRGPLPLRWVYLHMLRELAQHCGHADILREQILGG